MDLNKRSLRAPLKRKKYRLNKNKFIINLKKIKNEERKNRWRRKKVFRCSSQKFQVTCLLNIIETSFVFHVTWCQLANCSIGSKLTWCVLVGLDPANLARIRTSRGLRSHCFNAWRKRTCAILRVPIFDCTRDLHSLFYRWSLIPLLIDCFNWYHRWFHGGEERRN